MRAVRPPTRLLAARLICGHRMRRPRGGGLGADPQLWHFATAPRDVVDRFATAFGVSVIREADKTITHNVRTAVVDPDGKVLAIHDGMEWTPEQIATELRRALSAR